MRRSSWVTSRRRRFTYLSSCPIQPFTTLNGLQPMLHMSLQPRMNLLYHNKKSPSILSHSRTHTRSCKIGSQLTKFSPTRTLALPTCSSMSFSTPVSGSFCASGVVGQTIELHWSFNIFADGTSSGLEVDLASSASRWDL